MKQSESATELSAKATSSRPSLSFWRWLRKGVGGGPGIRRILGWAFPLHLAVGAVLAWLAPLSIQESANTVLLPLAGIFIGLTFAWIGNAQALLLADEIEELAQHRPGGLAEYVFTFQLAVLVLLLSLVVWGVGGLGVYEQRCVLPSCPSWLYFMAESLLFASSSLALRECWQVVVGAHSLLLVRKQIRDRRGGKSV